MMTEKTKTIILIIGVILACLLLIQGISLGLADTVNVGSFDLDTIPKFRNDLVSTVKISLLP